MNVLALAALHVWRRPLPEILRDEVMNPIGASNTWRWHGYENSWIDLDGQRMQSVTGGGHWGGGMFISARDMARFGYLFLRQGRWNDRQIVSEKWIQMARTPGPANQEYGYMNWFLNTGRKPLPSAPESSVTFRGNGAEHHLHRLGQRPRRRGALDPRRAGARRVPRQDPRSADPYRMIRTPPGAVSAPEPL